MIGKKETILSLIFLFFLFSYAYSKPIFKEVDVGKVIQGTPITHVFYIENRKNKPIHILSVAPG